MKTPIQPSAAAESLLKSFLIAEGKPTGDLLLYSRPAAWADIVITKKVKTPTTNPIDIAIDTLTLELAYDYTPKRPDLNVVYLHVRPTESTLMPLFRVSTEDLKGRQDGVGNFYRSYMKNTPITVEAPSRYGVWKFVKWTDPSGTATLGTSRLLRHR